MAWSTTFANRLRDKDAPYAPQFRLMIGTHELVGTSRLGGWNLFNRSLELLSHPDTASTPVAGTEGRYYGMTEAPATGGVHRMYGVALTGSVTLGAQSVVPRTWVFTGPTLAVGVTRWGASKASQMLVGAMSRLQIRLADDADQDWETIHIGMYRGMSWAGNRYTLNFGCALDIAKQRATDNAVTSVGGPQYQWFKAMGTKDALGIAAYLVNTETDFGSGASYVINRSDTIARNDRGFGTTSKNLDSFGGLDYHFGGAAAYPGGRLAQQWCEVTNTSSNKSFIRYEDHIDGGTSSQSVLTTCTSIGTLEMPGYDAVTAGTITGGFGSGSHVVPVCVLHGTPVTEFVNTVYIEGYAPQMVPGIFAQDWGDPNGLLNEADIWAAHAQFNRQFERANAVEGHRNNCPFRSVVRTEQSDGVALMKKLCGKWGVFPRFKRGGYGMAVIDGLGHVRAGVLYGEEGGTIGTVNEADRLINVDDIESVELKMTASNNEGGFSKVDFATTDPDCGAPLTDLDFLDSSSGTIHVGLPQSGVLTVSTTDVAAGTGNISGAIRWSGYYAQYFTAFLFEDFWKANRYEVNVRLRGLTFAALAPGDWVHIHIPESATGLYPLGPWRAEEIGADRNLLDSTGNYGLDKQPGEIIASDVGPEQRPYLVMSSHVDWVGCRVTLVLSRVAAQPDIMGWNEEPFSIVSGEMEIVEPRPYWTLT